MRGNDRVRGGSMSCFVKVKINLNILEAFGIGKLVIK